MRRIHFFSNDDRATAAVAIAEHFGDAGVVATAVAVADDGASWAALSQANLRAIRVGRVVVAPPWDRPTDASDIVPVIVHPSTGFGDRAPPDDATLPSSVANSTHSRVSRYGRGHRIGRLGDHRREAGGGIGAGHRKR